MPLVGLIVHYALRAYMLLILVYVFASWFPQWRFQRWFGVVTDIVRPYLGLFNGLPLRMTVGMGVLDLSPIVALLLLGIVDWLLIAAVVGGTS